MKKFKKKIQNVKFGLFDQVPQKKKPDALKDMIVTKLNFAKFDSS